MNRHTNFTVITIVSLGLVVLAGIWYVRRPVPDASTMDANVPAGCKVLYWTDTMIPGFKSDKPGKSPMNMDMTPVCAEDQPALVGANTKSVVTVQPGVLQNLGLRTYQVRRGPAPSQRVEASGYLQRDERGYFLLVDLFDRDVRLVRSGVPAEVNLPDAPGKRIRARVASVAREDVLGVPGARARIRLLEAGNALQDDLLATVIIQGAPASGAALYIPREAVIRTGGRTAVVLALGQGRFQPIDVVPGTETDDWIEIRRGLKDGDTVVTSGQFLIDSEASVRSSFARMQSDTPAEAPARGGQQP